MLKVSPNLYSLLGDEHLSIILKHRNLINHQSLHESKLRYFDELIQKEMDSARPRRLEARYYTTLHESLILPKQQHQ